MLRVGDQVEDFEAVDQHGRSQRLSDMLGAGPVVVYFYPRAMTSGCTIESRHFNDLVDDFQAVGAQIVGVSSDSVDRQRRFREACALDFSLLSDRVGGIARRFGANRLGRLPFKRVTFVIGGDGVVLRVIRSETNMHVHADEALHVLRDAAAR